MQPVVSAEAWQAEEIFLVYVQKALRPQRDETEASCRARTDEASALTRNPPRFASHIARPKCQIKSFWYHRTTVAHSSNRLLAGIALGAIYPFSLPSRLWDGSANELYSHIL